MHSLAMQPVPMPKRWQGRLALDNTLLLAVVLLVAFGIVMVASSSIHLGARQGDAMHYVNRHLLALVIGLLAAVSVFFTPSSWWEKNSTALYFVGIALLLAVLIPGLGREANGAMRWIKLGPFSLQASEFMKLFVVLYLAGYLVRRQQEVTHSLWGFIKPIIMLMLACVLIIMQPDFGTAAVLLATTFGLLFLAGAPLWQFALLSTIAAGFLSALIYYSPYRMARMSAFLDPWQQMQDAGYQLTQALIAFGRGEWTGVGLGNGIQKQFYLPEAHTDFVMAVIGEEFGLLGSLMVIALFSIIIWRAFRIGAHAEKRQARYAAYVAYGLGFWLGIQAFLNIGVNMGLLPTKGLTLPFISFGSNSLIVCLIAVAMLLRVSVENAVEPPNQQEGTWQRV
jgi:cell division protein FtsW